MTILQALNQYYGRMEARGDAEPPGYSRENISVCIWLNEAGMIIKVDDLNSYDKKKPVPRRLEVPKAINRASGVASNFLWDKTAYTLGVGLDKDKKNTRFCEKEHAEFKRFHQERLAGTSDVGLKALLAFLDIWKPEMFLSHPDFTPDMRDKNIIFGLVGEKLEYLHQRPAARLLIAAPADIWKTGICLVTGQEGPIERLHPSIKGVDGAQPSGAVLISYNANAFTSYGAEGGANAPTSVQAAFNYGTALNRLLDRGGSNRLKVGDTTIAFWADAEGVGEAAARNAEDVFGGLAEPPDDEAEAHKIRTVLKQVCDGQAVPSLNADLNAQTKFYILGLAPNAARLSVRYWLTDTFDKFVDHLAAHYADIDLVPAPWRDKLPPLWLLLLKTTAAQEKSKNIPPQLAGETMRAVLSGRPYPRTLLATAIMRLRAGDSPKTGWHAAIIKACINRMVVEKEKLPVSLQSDYPDPAYQLGRLFAVMEAAQRAALGRVNASITDRYYGAASTTPARVFGSLLRNARHHISDARKRGKGGWIDKRLGEIFAQLDPALPKTLTLEQQGRFAVGYYHEHAFRGEGKEKDADDIEDKGDEE